MDGRRLDEGGFWALVGIRCLSAEAGRATALVALRPDHTNYNEVAHGGVVASLVDSAAGFAVRSVRAPDEIAARPHATSDLHVAYLAAATGTSLRAEAEVVKAGRTAVFTTVDVFDDRERRVARASVTFVIAARGPRGA